MEEYPHQVFFYTVSYGGINTATGREQVAFYFHIGWNSELRPVVRS